MKKIYKTLLALLLLIVGSVTTWADIQEKVVYSTKFQDWDAVSSSTTETNVEKTTTDGQTLTFSLMETQCNPTGTQTKFTAECITTGYLMAAKTATPYIKTSALKSVTSITFVHAATGSNRGWGVKVKGDGDADWVIVSSAVANPASGQEVTLNINRTNVQICFYNLNSSQNAYLTSLQIKGNVEVAARTFKPFKIDFRTDPYKVILPETGVLPEGVSVTGGTFHDNQHGYTAATLSVAVDGSVKFKIGGCQYSNQATVSVNGGAATTIATQPAGCDKTDTDTHFVEYTYNSESPATLTFNLGNYCPFIYAEACDYVPTVTVSYYNTDGKLIGEEVVDGSSALKYKYSEKDVTVPEGQAFRGWFESKATTACKVLEGKELSEDTKLYAKASDIEKATVGSHFDYDMTKNYWYVEDHELISINGKYYNNHGWLVNNTNSIQIQVAGKCYVNVKNCQFSGEQDAVVTDANGNQVATFQAKASADGAVSSFKYDGPATTLTITYPSGAYVHGVEIYNVAEFVAFDETTGYYTIASGDASSLMMVLKSAKDGDKIYLPNGTYDFGEVCLTTISANNVSVVGESQKGVIIRNTPLVEGIGVTATLLLTGKNIYFQDLSIECSSEKCATPSASRCVTIQDKGSNNICKNVSLLSGQDTYYSNGGAAQKAYFEDCYITGTVDFICGGGDVMFKNTKFYILDRSSANVICAPNTDASTKWGYVMQDCSIDAAASQAGKYNLCRPWNGSPACTWLNTKMIVDGSAAGYTSMTNNLALRFHEYNTQKADGSVCTSHNLTACKGASSDELYLTADKAAQYTIANIYGTWAPNEIAAQVENVEDGKVFLVDGKITTVAPTSGKVRIANARGGFGPEVEVVAGDVDTYTVDAKIEASGLTKVIKNQTVKIKWNKEAKTYDVTLPAASINSGWSMAQTTVKNNPYSYNADETFCTLGIAENTVIAFKNADGSVENVKVTATEGGISNPKTGNGVLNLTVTGVSDAKGQVKVTYSGANVSTGINAVSAVKANLNGKFIQNGKLVIVKDGKQYNVAGVELK